MSAGTVVVKKKKETALDIEKIQKKFQNAEKEMKKSLIERDGEIEVVLTALIANQHPLLVGPPGTAKSMLLDSLMRFMDKGTKFNILMNKFSTPEELFGPIDVPKLLKDNQYTRVTTGQLPEADLAFLDEIFKSSSAILTTILKILNERKWRNCCGTEVDCPLLMCVAASNEFPNGQELGALYDRFLFRRKVKPISNFANRRKLLFGALDHTPQFTETISRNEIIEVKKFASTMKWSGEAKDKFLSIWKELNQNAIFPGDRRCMQSRLACQAYAFLKGATEVKTKHLTILTDTMWEDPEDKSVNTCYKIVMKYANPGLHFIQERLLALNEIIESPGSIMEKMSKIDVIDKEVTAAISENDSDIKEQREQFIAFIADVKADLYNQAIKQPVSRY